MSARETKNLGTFEVGPKVIVTDPCYDRIDESNWLQQVVDVKPGKWKADVEIVDEGFWGRRVACLYASHIDDNLFSYLQGREYKERFLGSCGVDSGQLGFFDYAKYPIGVNGYDTDYDNPDNWYAKACKETYDEKIRKFAGIVEGMGVNSSSGFGDGNYKVYALKDDKNEVIGLKAVFIGDEEDYDED